MSEKDHDTVQPNETERKIVAWIRAQAAIARGEGRGYMAGWLERLASAIERGEHR